MIHLIDIGKLCIERVLFFCANDVVTCIDWSRVSRAWHARLHSWASGGYGAPADVQRQWRCLADLRSVYDVAYSDFACFARACAAGRLSTACFLNDKFDLALLVRQRENFAFQGSSAFAPLLRLFPARKFEAVSTCNLRDLILFNGHDATVGAWFDCWFHTAPTLFNAEEVKNARALVAEVFNAEEANVADCLQRFALRGDYAVCIDPSRLQQVASALFYAACDAGALSVAQQCCAIAEPRSDLDKHVWNHDCLKASFLAAGKRGHLRVLDWLLDRYNMRLIFANSVDFFSLFEHCSLQSLQRLHVAWNWKHVMFSNGRSNLLAQVVKNACNQIGHWDACERDVETACAVITWLESVSQARISAKDVFLCINVVCELDAHPVGDWILERVSLHQGGMYYGPRQLVSAAGVLRNSGLIWTAALQGSFAAPKKSAESCRRTLDWLNAYVPYTSMSTVFRQNRWDRAIVAFEWANKKVPFKSRVDGSNFFAGIWGSEDVVAFHWLRNSLQLQLSHLSKNIYFD